MDTVSKTVNNYNLADDADLRGWAKNPFKRKPKCLLFEENIEKTISFVFPIVMML